MPDIQMCLNHKCPRRNKCHRYTAIPESQWQAYGKYTNSRGKKCDSFWNNAGYARKKSR